MKKFVYRGPVSSITVDEGKVVMLIDGEEVELSEDHAHVISLVEHKRLVDPPAPPPKDAPKKSTASSASSSPDQSPPSKRGQQGAR